MEEYGKISLEGSESIWKSDDSPEWVPSEADILRYVISGQSKYLQKRSLRTVRVFLSSTFTDMYMERNALLNSVYPLLQAYCTKTWKADFQLVDMRWGVRNEATNDHSASILCMAELKNCQEVSLGPNFVMLLGQRYGSRPLPSTITDSEFELLVSALNAKQTTSEDMQLLEQWYVCDNNNVPPKRLLQPLDQMKIDMETFDDLVKPRLQCLLRTAADECHRLRVIDESQRLHYFWSVTEEELYHGIVKAANVNEHCLCFERTLTNINLKDKIASRFIDVNDDGVIDAEAQALLNSMRNEVLMKMDESNVIGFTVPWCDNGGTNELQHAEYLKDFCSAFYEKVKGLIDRAACRDDAMTVVGRSPLMSEVAEHTHQAIVRCATFRGREDILSKVQDYMHSNSVEPFTIYGQSGCGKTSVMATASIRVVDWLGGNGSLQIVRRFLGTTRDSTNVELLLSSIAEQVASYCGFQVPRVSDHLLLLANTFQRVPSGIRLVVFLDSLDQLSAVGMAHTLKWIPLLLPPNIKLVLSTLPNEHNILPLLRSRRYVEDQFIQIKALDGNTSILLLQGWLTAMQRQLTAEQINVVKERLTEAAFTNPLHVKLLLDILKKTASYTDMGSFLMLYKQIDNTRKCIAYIFNELRRKHGHLLVDTAFAFLHLSRQGLTQDEIVHLLSLDDKVLNDVFQFHVAPFRRLPAVLWMRIRHEISEYMIERDANGSKILAWYHRQFVEVGRNEFVTLLQPERQNELQLLMVDFFTGAWANGKPKPFTYTDAMAKKLKLESAAAEKDRMVPEQPDLLVDGQPNTRKLSQLPELLVAVRKTHLFLSEFICKTELLRNIFTVYSWSEFIEIFYRTGIRYDTKLSKEDFAAFNLLLDCFKLSATAATLYPTSFGLILSGRLSPLYGAHPVFDELLKNIYEDGIKHNSFVASHTQLEGLGSMLQFDMSNYHDGPCSKMLSFQCEGNNYCVSISRKVVMLDLRDGNICMTYAPVYLHGDNYFKVLAINNSQPSEYFAASLSNSPTVYVFSAIQKDCIGKFHCSNVSGCEHLTITNMEISQFPSSNVIVVWGSGQHVVLVYDATSLELLYRFSNGHNIHTVGVVPSTAKLIVCQPHMVSTVRLTSDNNELQNEQVSSSYLNLPPNLKLTAQHKQEWFLIMATDDGCIFFLGTPPAESERTESTCLKLLLDSQAHCISSHEGVALVCTQRSIYFIDLKFRSRPSIQCHFLCTFDWAGLVEVQRFIAYKNDTVSLYDLADPGDEPYMDEFLSLNPHDRPITSALLLSNIILTSSTDGSIRAFNYAKPFNPVWEKVFKCDRMGSKLDQVCGAGDLAMSMTKDSRAAALWSLRTGKIIKKLEHGSNGGALRGAVVLNEHAISADASDTVYFWKVTGNTEAPFSTFPLGEKFVAMLVRSPGDALVITQSSVWAFEVSTAQVISRYSTPAGVPVLGFSWNDEQLAVLVDKDKPTVELVFTQSPRTIRLYDIPRLESFGSSISDIYYTRNTLVLAYRKHVVFYNYYKETVTLSVPVYGPQLVKSLRGVVAIQCRFNVLLYKVHGGISQLGSLKLSSSRDQVELSPDGQHCLVTRAPKTLQLYHLSDMTLVGLYPTDSEVGVIAFTLDNKYALAALSDTRLLIFMVLDEKCVDHKQRLPDRFPVVSEQAKLERRQLLIGDRKSIAEGSGRAPLSRKMEALNKLQKDSQRSDDYCLKVIQHHWQARL